MKRQISVSTTAVLMAGTSANRGSKETAPETTTAASTTEAATEAATAEETTVGAETTAVAGGLKTGMAIVSSMENSKDTDEKNGNAQVDSIVAAVVIDTDGKIIKYILDAAQNKVIFIAEGRVIIKGEFKTKQELEGEYNVKPASGIGKEWCEQTAAMEEFVIDKTIAEVKGTAVGEDNKLTNADFAAGCTVAVGDLAKVISQAAENIAGLGTQEGSKLGLGVVTIMDEHTKDATIDTKGQCGVYSTYVATTAGADDKTTANIIDYTQGVIKFDTTGKITSDLATDVGTRKQKGGEYGMRVASGIGREWSEQAAAMEEFMIGRAADEVKGIAVNEGNKPTDADPTVGCTMSIGNFQGCVVEAAAIVK